MAATVVGVEGCVTAVAVAVRPSSLVLIAANVRVREAYAAAVRFGRGCGGGIDPVWT